MANSAISLNRRETVLSRKPVGGHLMSEPLVRRLPLDFASFLSVSHVPLLQDSPLVELREALARRGRAVPREEAHFRQIVNGGLSFTTVHFGRDYQQLHLFDKDFEGGRFFVTKKAVEKVVSRTTLMWFEADKYLQVSFELRQAVLSNGEAALANATTTSTLAESTLNLATHVLDEFKKVPARGD